MANSSENACFEMLCDQEQSLQENHKRLGSVVRIMNNLTELSNSEAEQVRLLKSLSEEYQGLVESSIDLRYVKYHTRESQIAALKRTRRNDSFTRLQNVEGLAACTTLCETVGQDYLTYISLLERLSVDLVKQIEIADPSVTEFVVDEWNPPKGIYAILEELGDPNSDSDLLKSRLERYLDQIKMERAKYTIENKHSLQGILRDLNKEVNNWRKEWDSIENLLFGDNTNSMKKMLQNIESLRSKLEVRKDEEIKDKDVSLEPI